MNLIGFVIGLAVMALTTYIAALPRRREYGVLKALGARNGHLYRAVLAQALPASGWAWRRGLAFTCLSEPAPRLGTNLTLVTLGARSCGWR